MTVMRRSLTSNDETVKLMHCHTVRPAAHHRLVPTGTTTATASLGYRPCGRSFWHLLRATLSFVMYTVVRS
jgi:hypothetical protein